MITIYHTPGVDVYVRINGLTVGTTPGAGVDADKYTISDAELLAAGLNTPGTYTWVGREGDELNPLATDPHVAVGSLAWDGTEEIELAVDVVNNVEFKSLSLRNQ